jgi:hypothetical protein
MDANWRTARRILLRVHPIDWREARMPSRKRVYQIQAAVCRSRKPKAKGADGKLSERTFERIKTKKGRRRAAIVIAADYLLKAAILFALGYLACAIVAGLQVLAGVWG